MKIWRGMSGDVHPVEVENTSGLRNANGYLRAGYYHTPVEAWAGILAAWREDESVADGELDRVYADYLNAQKNVQAVRRKAAMATSNYQTWQRTVRESGKAAAV